MGGASVHLIELIKNATKVGMTVTVVVGGRGVLIERLEELKCEIISIDNLCRELNLVLDIKCIIQLVKVIKKINPDLLHLHSAKAGFVGRIAAWFCRVPVVYTVHGWPFTDGVSQLKKLIYRIIERLMIKFTDAVITVSKFDKQLALDYNFSHQDIITPVQNGMPLNNCLDLNSKMNNPRLTGNIRLIMVARFDQQKNQESLISSLSTIKNKEWTLDFIGDGPTLTLCKNKASELRLTDKVFFLGSCNDVNERLSKSDVFCVSQVTGKAYH